MATKTRTTFSPKDTILAYVAGREGIEPAANTKRGSKYHTVTQLEKFLGRPALLSDLNDETLTMFFDWLGERPNADGTKTYYERMILAIARDAAQCNIIEWPAPNWKSRTYKRDSAQLGWQQPLQYFDEVYLEMRQAADHPLSRSTIKSYRSALRAFEKFAPNIRLHTTDRPRLLGFREWLLRCGMNAKKAGNHTFVVGLMLKHAKPERLVESVDNETPTVDSMRTLAYVFEHHYLPAKQTIASEKTEWKYGAVFNAFGRFLGRVATLDDLTDESVGAYMRDLRRAGKSTRTINGYRSKLIALWSWCAKTRLLQDFPTVEKMPEAATIACAWNRDELPALMAACSEMPGTIAGVLSADWWRCLHLVAFDTGERIGAIRAITWNMLDTQTGNLVIPAEFRKGGRKPMLYQLKRETLCELQLIDRPEREFVFPWEHGSFYSHYKRLLKIAGLPYVPYKSAMQKMRRSFATHLEANGGNATEAMSHSMRSITEESYLDPRLIERTPPNRLLFSLVDAAPA
jgi:integrase